MSDRIELIVRNQSFIVRTKNQKVLNILNKLEKDLTIFELVKEHIRKGKFKVKFKVKDKYICGNIFRNEYIFPYTYLYKFINTLLFYNIDKSLIDYINNKDIDPDIVELKMNPTFKDRDYQTKYIETVLKLNKPTSLIDLQTGKGKTYIATRVLTELSYRIGIIVLPKYMSKWINDLKTLMQVTDSDILTINGSEELINLMLMDRDKLPKVVIFSNRTLSLYQKEYEEAISDIEFKYPINPQDLMEHLGIGSILIDEAHQEFTSVFKNITYSNVKLALGLSATLVSNDKKMNRIYDIIFPDETRLSLLPFDRYIIAESYKYKINDMRGIKFKTSRGYSHTLFELSILKDKKLLDNYIDMITKLVDENYIEKMGDDDKCIIFFDTIKMCTVVTKELKKRYKDLDVRRYVGEDPYENVIEPDIRVTTPKSAGTAIDIPGLIYNLITVARNSVQENLQIVGRLRKRDDIDVKATCLVCTNIKQHKQYSKNRKELFKYRVKAIIEKEHNTPL